MRTETSLVSVVIPCYNYGHLLHDTLNSVLAQTYQYWECLIVDDGSTDTTRELTEKYIKLDSRFKYVYQHNKGLAAARNTGLKLSKGQYIQLLDADDILPLRKVETHVTLLANRPEVDLVYGPVYVFQKDISAIPAAREVILQPPSSGAGDHIIISLLEDNLFLVHCTLFRSSIIQEIGFFDEEMITCEDWNFWFRCALRGKHFLFVDDDSSKVYVRSHGSNMSGNRKNMWIGKVYFQRKASQLIDSNKAQITSYKKIKGRNIQLLHVTNTRLELVYGNLFLGLVGIVKTIYFTGDFFYTLRDSLYWIRERLLNKV